MPFCPSICPDSTIHTDSCACQDETFASTLIEELFDTLDRIGVRDIGERVDECRVLGGWQGYVRDGNPHPECYSRPSRWNDQIVYLRRSRQVVEVWNEYESRNGPSSPL
jgi:hypothetical protein